MADFLQDPFSWIGGQLAGWLGSLGLAPAGVTFVLQLLGAFVLATAMLLLTFLLIWAERKIVARIQDRLGPNRVGPFGVFQTVADLLKLVTKELITPTGADLIPYNLAPLLAVMSVVGLWAVIPMAPTLLGAQISTSGCSTSSRSGRSVRWASCWPGCPPTTNMPCWVRSGR